MLARLPGKSARIGAFMDQMVQDGRVRDFAGRLELWDTAPLDDTAAAAAEMRERLGL
jgi:mitochondrial fission protein ELM1